MNLREAAQQAREAGDDWDSTLPSDKAFLDRFAALVAAAEREACVQIVEEYRIPVGNSVAGELAREWTYYALKEIREDIRARGNK